MAICVITFLLQAQWLFPLLRYFFLTPNTISKFMDLRTFYSTSWVNQFCQGLTNTWWFTSFQIFKDCENPKPIRLTSAAQVCVLQFPNIINTVYIQHKWKKLFFHIFKVLWGYIQTNHPSHPSPTNFYTGTLPETHLSLWVTLKYYCSHCLFPAQLFHLSNILFCS
jgi:hypothetical protein